MKPEEHINIESDYKKNVLEIWDKYGSLSTLTEPNKEYRQSPLLPDKVKKGSLLFIGINPSFNEKTKITDSEKKIGFYSTELIEKNKSLPYFEKFKEIAKYCKKEWTHIDLFFIRETNQKVIEYLAKKEIDFLNAQLDISFDIITKSSPQLIVVSNAFASEFFGKKKSKHKSFNRIWKGFEFIFEDNDKLGEKNTFDASIGTYRIKLANQNIPIIFSGMLSGQRSLDLGSMERLKWQIKHILENK